MSGRRGWPGQEHAIYPGQCQQEGLLGSQEHALSSVCLFLSPILASCPDDRSLIYPQGGANPLLGLPLPPPILASCPDDRSLIYPQGGANPRRPRAQRSHHENSAPKGPLQVITSTTICRTTWSMSTRPSHPPVEVSASPPSSQSGRSSFPNPPNPTYAHTNSSAIHRPSKRWAAKRNRLRSRSPS